MATRTPSKAPAEFEVLKALLRQASDDEDSKVAFQAYYHQGGRLKPTDLLDMLVADGLAAQRFKLLSLILAVAPAPTDDSGGADDRGSFWSETTRTKTTTASSGVLSFLHDPLPAIRTRVCGIHTPGRDHFDPNPFGFHPFSIGNCCGNCCGRPRVQAEESSFSLEVKKARVAAQLEAVKARAAQFQRMATETPSTQVSEHLWDMARTSEELVAGLQESLNRLDSIGSLKNGEWEGASNEFVATPDVAPVPNAIVLFFFFLSMYLSAATYLSKSLPRCVA